MRLLRLAAACSVFALAACASILGFDDVEPKAGSGGDAGAASDGGGGQGGGTGATGGSGGAVSTGGMGGMSGVGGMGGMGGALGGSGGTPLLPLGDPCAQPNECQSTQCVDDVCCDETCGSVCERCDAPGSEGTCTPRLDSTDDEDDCLTTVCDEGACTVNPIDVWSNQASASSDAAVNDIAVDASGNVWLLGHFTGMVAWSGAPCGSLTSMGNRDIFLVKLDPGGRCAFATSFGDAAQQDATGIALDANDNVYITGFFQGTVSFGGNQLTGQGGTRTYVAKFAPNGAHTASFASSGTGVHEAIDISISPGTGDVYVGGHFTGDLTVSTTVTAMARDVFVLKMVQTLGQTWLESWPNAGNQALTALAADHAGRAVLGVDPGQGNPPAEFVCPDSFEATASMQHALLRLDSSGDCEIGVEEDDGNLSIRAIAVDASDRIYFTGAFDGTSTLLVESASSLDLYVMVLNAPNPPAVQSPWHEVFGGLGEQHGRAIIVDGTRVAVAGVHDGIVTHASSNLVGASTDVDRLLVMQLSTTNGTPLFARSYGSDPLLQEPRALAINPWRSIVVGGAFGGALGGLQVENALSTTATSDGFVLAISPAP